MRIAVVTGGVTGIGRAITSKFSKEGYKVVALYNKSKNEAEEVSASFNCDVIKCDVSKLSECEKVVETIISKYNGIDVLVNNAGVDLYKLIQETSEEEYNFVFDINMRGTFNMTKCVIPHMLNKPSSIVNISSIWGRVGASYEAIYSASKGAINAFTLSCSKELAPSKIRVNAIAPGAIDTKMNDCLSTKDKEDLIGEIPLNRFGKPEEVADLVYSIATNEYITGEVISIDGGFNK